MGTEPYASRVTSRDRRTVEVRREEMLAATTGLLDRIGLAAIRVSDVARALDVSPGLVFYHFGNKDALVAEAFDRLRRVLRLYGPTGSATGWRLWIDAWALAQREPTIRAVLRRMDRRWCAVLRAVVEQGVAEDAFECVDPEAMATRISALLDGLSVAMLVYRSVSRRQLREWVAGAVAQELGLDAASLV